MDKITNDLIEPIIKDYKLSDDERRIFLDIAKNSIILFSSIVDENVDEEKLVELNGELSAVLTSFFQTLIVISKGGSVENYVEWFNNNRKKDKLYHQININKLMLEAVEEINEAQDNNNR